MQAKATIEIERGDPNSADEYRREDKVVVTAIWLDCDADSNYGMAWSLGAPTPRSRKLAERLAAAIDAGAVFGPPSIKRNVHGETYVSAAPRVMGRYLNANLRRLGF